MRIGKFDQDELRRWRNLAFVEDKEGMSTAHEHQLFFPTTASRTAPRVFTRGEMEFEPTV